MLLTAICFYVGYQAAKHFRYLHHFDTSISSLKASACKGPGNLSFWQPVPGLIIRYSLLDLLIQ
jgi:hypothetical protein